MSSIYCVQQLAFLLHRCDAESHQSMSYELIHLHSPHHSVLINLIHLMELVRFVSNFPAMVEITPRRSIHTISNHNDHLIVFQLPIDHRHYIHLLVEACQWA